MRFKAEVLREKDLQEEVFSERLAGTALESAALLVL